MKSQTYITVSLLSPPVLGIKPKVLHILGKYFHH